MYASYLVFQTENFKHLGCDTCVQDEKDAVRSLNLLYRRVEVRKCSII